MKASPPLRFLAVVLGGWAALRTALIAPPWPAPMADAAAVPAARARPRPAPGPGPPAGPVETVRPDAADRRISAARTGPPLGAARPRAHGDLAPSVTAPAPAASAVPPSTVPPLPAPIGAVPAEPDPASGPVRRWSLSAWSFLRRGNSGALAAGGVLGGSQAGARISYRLNRDSARPLALYLRLSAPMQSARGTEAALGFDWQPDRRLPVHVIAERRQALGREGRSAFAAGVHGGVGDAPLGPFRVDAYAQAGLVGARSRDPFGDGAIRLSLPMGEKVRLGAGLWAAAQPGLSRLDVGPQAAIRLPVAGRALTLAADWRVRVGGNARPGSGPTLTLSTDF